MKITFVLPCYVWAPSGGAKVVYEYSSRLVKRGHEVTVVHPLRLSYAPVANEPIYQWARKQFLALKETHSRPTVTWMTLDSRVRLAFVPNANVRYIPDADVIFATAWNTVSHILRYPDEKGEKCYLIQGYEVWQGPKDLVDATWKSDLRKVVVSKWLLDLAQDMGCSDVDYIPNAIDRTIYKVIRPIAARPKQVAMLFSTEEIKGCRDGFAALDMVRKKYPDLKVQLFGTARPQPWIPSWVTYHRNPEQQFIIQEIYNGSSVFLSPSWSEGFALPPAEAMACGCAVVGTDSGGIRDFVVNEATGLLSPPKNPESLADNLCRILDDDYLRQRLAEAGNSRILGFDWERSAEQMEQFIERAAAQQKSRVAIEI